MRNHAGIAARMFRLLADEGINIEAISTSEIKTSCLVEAKYARAFGARSCMLVSGLRQPAAP